VIITEILGNAHDDDGAALIGGRHREHVDLDGTALVKRTQRLRTDHGHEYGLRLPAGSPDLRDGDILALQDGDGRGNAVLVRVLSSDVLVIRARSLREMAFVAHSLGNRHLPAQFFAAGDGFGGEAMVVQYDHTVEDFLRAHDVPHDRQERVMDVPFRHAEHTH